MNPASVLIVEDDTKLRHALKEIMTREGYAVDATESGDTAVSMIKDTVYDLVITDLKLPGIDGMDVLRSVQKLARDTSVIIITAYATVDTAVEAMKEGAEDYIAKPFNLEEIRLVVRKVLDKKALVDDNRFLRNQLKKKYSFGNLVGNSEAMVEVYKTIEKIKNSRATILILGETGTGKELVARAIHFNSIRSEKPFLPVNCAALAETLLESELFGYVKGAFTGAVRDKQGVFEVAHGGTVFLDEIGDISPRLQQILLRVLENGEIQPVGSTVRRKVDVRVVAATNRDLGNMVKQGTFRADLYYRLNVISLELPPLRMRTEDIAMLAGHFLRKYAAENEKAINDMSRDALQLLERYTWPGNVRELENVVERATLLETS
ncbi:MAG: sigma-54-dependent Fis family transcriptional regulator, partial [Syntrophorhabdus sp.]|nr:sigma-54-dependent Fis family transcriptional regulator [Syntrophorhabdus sp.]